MKRTLGHEIMNGFNYELMATFKCNNDIQILLGGSDVANCMQYCCKIVNASADQDEPKFQAVSFLDDYIFRPDELENVNLYEFTMWYFRTRNDNGSSNLGFIDGHPLQSTHRLGKSGSQKVEDQSKAAKAAQPKN
ncbi:hypothetical protein GQ600_23655 [Phytophthora cactorum]|nr:hypothetical protein GQ600_23655 [Phytophthora cactorum]